MRERFVVLGLGRPRSTWFGDVTRWANSASLPLEFVKCVSAEEAIVRLRSGRVWSAFLVDPTITGVDRDLFELARATDTAVLTISRANVDSIRWLDLGATAVLGEPLDRQTLADVLETATSAVRDHSRSHADPDQSGWQGALVAVLGTPGAGASTVAMALSQGLATEPAYLGSVLLADLALEGDQGLLHDSREVIPGVQELVEAHRAGTPDRSDVAAGAFHVEERGYHLLLGLRRRRDWAALRPQAFDAALESLRRAYRLVIADCDFDTDGRSECGSVEVEERNTMARGATRSADLVIVVTNPGPRGIRRLVRITGDLVGSGVDPERLVAVVNRGPRSHRARAEIARTVPELLTATGVDCRQMASPVFLPERRRIEETHPGPTPLPRPLTAPITSAAADALDRVSGVPVRRPDPEQIQPGTLGSFGTGTDTR